MNTEKLLNNAPHHQQADNLKRAIGLPRLILYGLGVTIGAGIYVLVGETAGRAGIYAPSAFLMAAFVMVFSAASFAEFSGRVPQSAGESAFVDEGFKMAWLSALTGYAIILAGIVAAAAISLGSAGYISTLVDLPQSLIVLLIVSSMGVIAVWGIAESITIASILTLIEIVGLLVIIYAGFQADPYLITKIPQSIPAFNDGIAMTAIISASLLAFFAFVGFDDVVNVVEEAIEPAKIMPWAIGITLVVVTVLYFLISLIAVNALPLDELASSSAPVGLLFKHLTGLSPISIALIAIAATLNGIVIQIIMASRVMYGLGKKRYLPHQLSKVNKVTRTPVNATIIITLLALIFALYIPLDKLAEFTSQIILGIFFLVNLALVMVKWRGDEAPKGIFIVPIAIPVIGSVTCLFLLTAPLFI